LQERAILFHRKFGEIKISPSQIRKIYAKNGIKRKSFNFVKTLRYEDPLIRNERIASIK
jgi:hypothetical protein